MNNHIEFQCFDKDDFEFFKKYADYTSDLTHVVSIPGTKISLLKGDNPNILNKYVVGENIQSIKPTAYYSKDKIYIRNADIDILNFLECRSTYNAEVKIKNLKDLFTLIDSNIVDVDQSLKDKLYPLTPDSNISELLSSKGQQNFRGQRFNLTKVGDKISDLEFNKFPAINKNYFVRNGLKIVKEYDEKTKCIECKQNGVSYKLFLYYFPPAMSTQLQLNRTVNIMSEKILGNDEDGYKVFSPSIIPNGFGQKVIKEKVIKCPRSIPMLLYNSAFAEYNYRMKKED